MMYDIQLAEEILNDEGWEEVSYTDTKGYWTIGVGHMLGNDPQYANIRWSPRTVMLTFMDDLNRSIYYTQKQIRVLDRLSPNRQRVLINMMFNLGPNRFAGFKKTIAAIHNFDIMRAYHEMLDSKWAKEDVPNRANRLAERWLRG